MTNSNTLELDLRQFTGTDHYYKHMFGIRYSDGVKYLAERANCYWLLDAITSHQPECRKDIMLRDFQMWVLHVYADKSAILNCERDTDDVAITQNIEYTDFPLQQIKLYFQNGVLFLPSEY